MSHFQTLFFAIYYFVTRLKNNRESWKKSTFGQVQIYLILKKRPENKTNGVFSFSRKCEDSRKSRTSNRGKNPIKKLLSTTVAFEILPLWNWLSGNWPRDKKEPMSFAVLGMAFLKEQYLRPERASFEKVHSYLRARSADTCYLFSNWEINRARWSAREKRKLLKGR